METSVIVQSRIEIKDYLTFHELHYNSGEIGTLKMHRLGNISFIIILLLSSLSFLLAGCSGEVQTAMTTGGISIARRGESILTPEATTAEPGISVTSTSAPANTEPPVLTPTTTETPEVTDTPPIPTPMPTQTGVLTADGSGQPTGQATEVGDICQATENRGFEAEVIALVNQFREENGIRVLAEQSQLTQAARLHSQDMACNQFFSHLSPTSGTLLDRIAGQDYEYSAAAENIAAGYITPAEVVEGWMDSLGHRTNLLNPQYTQVGVGYTFVADSANGTYWTIVLGVP